MNEVSMKRSLCKCFICGHQDDRQETVSYFLFPKDDEQKLAWLNFAELKADCDVSQFRLCSKHFADDCLKKNKNKLTLLSGAIPTLLPNTAKRVCNRQILHPKKCILCGSLKDADVPNVICVRFPVDDILKKKWAHACRIAVDRINHNSRLCCRHFKDTDFIEKIIRKGEIKKILKPDATPFQTLPERTDITGPKKSSKIRSSCIVCGYNSPDVSYHRFPSDDSRRKEWQRICELDVVNSKSTYVCGRHFLESDKIRQSHRTILTNTAIPTLNLVTFGFEEELVSNDNFSFSTISNELCTSTSANEGEQKPSIKDEIPEILELDVTSMPCNESVEPCSLVSIAEQESSESVEFSPVVPLTSQLLQACPSKTFELGFATHYNTTENLMSVNVLEQTSPETASSTPRTYKHTRTLKHLRYCGDVSLPDLATPQRAKRCWNLAKNTIDRKNKEIRSLREKNNRLKKKLENIIDLVHHFMIEGKFGENAAEMVDSVFN